MDPKLESIVRFVNEQAPEVVQTIIAEVISEAIVQVYPDDDGRLFVGVTVTADDENEQRKEVELWPLFNDVYENYLQEEYKPASLRTVVAEFEKHTQKFRGLLAQLEGNED